MTSEMLAMKNGVSFAGNATSSAPASPVKVSVSQAKDEAFWIKLAARYSSKLPARLNKSNHGFCCLKTSKGFYLRGGRLLELSSPPLWGTMSNGRYLTAKISACRNTENACILSDILEEKVDEKYFLSKERCEKFIWKNERIGVLPYKTGKLPQRCKVVRENGLSPTLLASNAYEPQMVAIRNNSPNKPFLAAQNGDNISLQPNARGSVRKGYSGTITTSPDAVLDDWRIRKLTPRECWRLQSMPEWAFDRAQKVCSDQQLYKQAGNGVTVNVVREIAKKLK